MRAKKNCASSQRTGANLVNYLSKTCFLHTRNIRIHQEKKSLERVVMYKKNEVQGTEMVQRQEKEKERQRRIGIL
jgi:hypothetical protein